jgi:hypothetical protein
MSDDGFRYRSTHPTRLAAVALHVAFYNLCRVRESLRSTTAMALGIANHVWSIGELLDAALKAVPPVLTPTAPSDAGNSG